MMTQCTNRLRFHWWPEEGSRLVLNNVKPNIYDDKPLGFASSAPTYDIAKATSEPAAALN